MRAGCPAVSGHASAAPYGWAGSVAASTIGAATTTGAGVGPLPHLAQTVDGSGQGELGRAEAADEVPAPDLAALLEHLQDPVHGRVPADHALGEHGLTGDHAVALDELDGRGVSGLGR